MPRAALLSIGGFKYLWHAIRHVSEAELRLNQDLAMKAEGLSKF